MVDGYEEFKEKGDTKLPGGKDRVMEGGRECWEAMEVWSVKRE